MKIFRLFMLALVWFITTGGGGPHCVSTDKEFGDLPAELRAEEWEGWWCGPNLDDWCPTDTDCCRVTVSDQIPGELLMDGISDEDTDWYVAYQLRRAPVSSRKDESDDGFWFVFFWPYMCGEQKCESQSELFWSLLRKKDDHALVWDQDGSAVKHAINDLDLPGYYDETGKVNGLMGSALSEDEMRLLLDRDFYELDLESPKVFIRSPDRM